MATKEEMYELVDHIWLILCNRRRLSMVTRHTPGMEIKDWIKLQQRNIRFMKFQKESDDDVLKLLASWNDTMLQVVINTASSHIPVPSAPYDIAELQKYRIISEDHERASMQ